MGSAKHIKNGSTASGKPKRKAEGLSTKPTIKKAKSISKKKVEPVLESESESESETGDELDDISVSGSESEQDDNGSDSDDSKSSSSDDHDDDNLDAGDIELDDKEDDDKIDDADKQSSKEQRAEQKKLLNSRKLSRRNGEKIQNIKFLWEKLRVKEKMPQEVRTKLVNQIWEESKDIIKDLVLKHDSSRVIQTIFKYANKKMRLDITNALKGTYYELATSSYGKYLLVKMLHYGTKETRQQILDELFGKFRKLMRNKEGAYVIEDAYRDYSTAAQRRQMIREFYGSSFALFKEEGKDQTIEQIISENSEKRYIIMNNLKDAITSAVNKGSIGFTIVHAILLEYVKAMNDSEKSDLIELISEQFAEIVHTNEGSQVACRILARATAKERKNLIKPLRKFAKELVKDEFGYTVLITLFDVVDDTVLVARAFLPEFKDDLPALLVDKWGRRPFLYLISGLSSKYFQKQLTDQFNIYHELSKDTSKKERSSRHLELKTKFSPAIIDTITSFPLALLKDNLGSQFISEALLRAEYESAEQKIAAFKAVINCFIGDPTESNHLIHHPFSPRLLRVLIQQGSWDNKNKKFDIISSNIETDETFGDLFETTIHDNLREWCTGAGSFAIVSLAEANKELGETIKKDYKKELLQAGKKGNKGALILAGKAN